MTDEVNVQQVLRDIARELFTPDQEQPVEPAPTSNYVPSEGRIPANPNKSEQDMRDFVNNLFTPHELY